MTIQYRMNHRTPLLLSAFLLTFATGCIKRQPAAVETAQATEGAATSEGDPAEESPAHAPTEPTGNWGKVDGVDVLGGKGVEAFDVSGLSNNVLVSTVAVDGQEFSEALRAEIKSQTPNKWDVQVVTRVPEGVEQGDVMLAKFYAKAEKASAGTGVGETEFVYELGEQPYTKSVTHGVSFGPEWTPVYVSFQAQEDYAPGKAQAAFRLGLPPQTILIGGVTIENFGKKLALADLPATPITYRGMSEKAEWRAPAQERILKHRFGTLEISVRNASGAPVAGAEVRIVVQKSPFVLGTLTSASDVLSNNEKYRELLTELFFHATLEDDLDWPPLAGDWGSAFTYDRAEKATAALNEAGLIVSGGTLVEPSYRNLPRAISDLSGDRAKLQAAVLTHIQEAAQKMKGRVVSWRVVDEPYDNHDLLDLLGEKVLVDWFTAAKKADPEARLLLSDGAILTGGGGTTPRRDYLESTLRMLIDAGAPVEGIGLKAHFGSTLTSPTELISFLDRYAQFKIPIYVTEFDVAALDGDLAANYLRDFYTALFSHPAVHGITMGGFWDGAHRMNRAPLFDLDFGEKAAAREYRKLLDSWGFNKTTKTDATGKIEHRGALGEVLVSAQVGEARGEATAAVTSGGGRVVVTVK